MRAKEAEAHVSAASTGKGGWNLPGTAAGAEARTAAGGGTKPEALRLMEAAVERSNMLVGNCPRPAKAGALDEARTFLDDDEGPEKAKLCGELS